MFKLIKNEHMKILNKRSNLFLFLSLFIAMIVIGFGTKILLNSAGVKENFLGYVSFSTSFLIILPFFIIAIAGSIVSNEFTWGTVKLLLIRPAKRIKILMAKYMTILLFSLYFLLFYFAISMILGFLLFGFAEIDTGDRLVQSILLKYLVCLIEMVMFASLAFAISTIFRNSSLATGVSIFLCFMGKPIVQLLAYLNQQWGKFLLFANTNLDQFFDGKPLFEGMSLTFSIIMLVLYFILFLGSSSFVFLKRDVSI